jgi:DNA-binding NarL/FixJ family response regulator
VGCQSSCALLAAPHHGLSEGIRSLLGTVFETVVMVVDERSLCEAARQLRPRMTIVDLVLARGDVQGLVGRLRLACAGMKVIFLSVHDEPAIAQAIRMAGADGLVVKGRIANDLLSAVAVVLRGEKSFPKETT